MSVTDTKEFIRMETAADKLGVDPVKLVRMMQDKKMMVRIEFPADRFEEVKWEMEEGGRAEGNEGGLNFCLRRAVCRALAGVLPGA